MNFVRMPIEVESPEEFGYEKIKFNLTESSYSDANLDHLQIDLRNHLLAYGDHRGHPKLRALIAQDHGVTANDVLITAGASSALFIIAISQIKKSNCLLVDFPNYATNLETPRILDANVFTMPRSYENGFKVNSDLIREKLQQLKLRMVSLTNPHNPTGVVTLTSELKELAILCAQQDCLFLVDETYGDLNLADRKLKLSELPQNVISVSSLSKSYGLPGIRTGWIVCRNSKLMETFLAAKEQIFITGSSVDEEIAFQFMTQKNSFFSKILDDVKEKRALLLQWLQNERRLEAVTPHGGVVAFPRIKGLKSESDAFLNAFYKSLNEDFGTYVGPGHWFQMPKKYFRIGYAWPSLEQLSNGLKGISQALSKCGWE